MNVRTLCLRASMPIAALAIASSVAGVASDSTYADETENWAGQAVGQDIANLIAYPVLVLLAVTAARGSVRAYLAWMGVLGYSAYTFAIYTFSLHFGRLFLVYVAVFGLSVYALIGGLATTNEIEISARFANRDRRRPTAILLIVIGSLFYALWLAEVIGATLEGNAPEATIEAGLLSNPVHVLDMALLLPCAVATGILLLRDRPWGFVLAPLVLGTFIFLSIGIVAAMLVLRDRGLDAPTPVLVGVVILTVVEGAFLWRFLSAINETPHSDRRK